MDKQSYTLKNQTLGGIQELAKDMWNRDILNGYVTKGNWEYLNNDWGKKAINYAFDSGQISKEALRHLAQVQIEKSNNRKGVYLTKTGRLAIVITKWLGEGTDWDEVGAEKTKEYHLTGVNPQTRHIYETKSLESDEKNQNKESAKAYEKEQPAAKSTPSDTFSVKQPAQESDILEDEENEKSDVEAKSEYVKQLLSKGYERAEIVKEPSDIIAFKNGEKYYFEIKVANSSKKGGGFGAATLTEWRQALETPDNYFFVVAWHYGFNRSFEFHEYTPQQFIKYSTIPPFKSISR